MMRLPVPFRNVPCLFDIVYHRHFRKRAFCSELGMKDLLVGLAEDPCHFGHKGNGAEHDILSIGLARSALCQLERITHKISGAHDVYVLIIMGKDDKVFSQCFFARRLSSRLSLPETCSCPVSYLYSFVQEAHIEGPG